MTFFAIATQHVGDFAFAGAAEPVRRGHVAALVHAHVEGTVAAEAEAPRGIVELRRRDADIEQDSRGTLAGGQVLPHFAEAGPHGLHAAIGARERVGGAECIRVGIEADEPRVRVERVEQPACVSAAAERAVNVESRRVLHERPHGLVRQDRTMLHHDSWLRGLLRDPHA